MGLLWRPSSVFDDGSDHIPSGFSEEMLPVVGFWEVDAIAKSIEGTRGPSQQPALLRHATQPDSAMRWTARVNAITQAQERFVSEGIEISRKESTTKTGARQVEAV